MTARSSKTLRLITIHHSPGEMAVIVGALSGAGYDVASRPVFTAEDLCEAVANSPWDAVTCGLGAPPFTASDALTTLKNTDLDLPLIVVSPSLTVALAADLMRAGARDCIPADDLSRLVAAVGREVGEAAARKARRDAENAARHHGEAARLRDALLLAHVRDSVIVTDLDGIVTYWNEGASAIFGWSAEEMMGRSLIEQFPRHVRAEMWQTKQAIVNGYEWSAEFEGYHKDRSRVWIDGFVTRITDDSGQPIGLMGVFHDITARKRAEAERDQVMARLRIHIERMPLAYLLLDADFRLIDWNPAAEMMFGYTKSEVLGMGPPFEKILPAPAWPVVNMLDRVRASDMTTHVINENVTKEGRTFTCEWYNTPLFDAEGAFLGLVAMALDISDRRRAEEALRASEERLRQIAQSISEVFWLRGPDRRLSYLSPGFETIWGRSRDSVSGLPDSWLETVHPEDRDRVFDVGRRTEAAGEVEYRIVRPDGTTRWIRDRGFPVRDDQDRVVGLAGVAEDITERRHLETQLRQAQKMEALGRLAGGVAHDFNNLLTVITGYCELLLDRLPPGDPLRDPINEIWKAGERSASLTRQLLAFARNQVLTPRVLDVNEIVADTEKMLRRVIGEHIELTTVLHPLLARVKTDPGQLEQVLLNLAINARDAMPGGGRLRIETSNVQLGEEHAAAHPGVAPGSYVMLEMTDSGNGMTEEVKRHVFEPFFTTKDPGKGTGLGLAVLHGFVEQSGGHVDLASEHGRGTSFKIYLPAVDSGHVEPRTRPASRSAVSALPGGTETILLVEDQEGVRALTKRVLEGCGYTVLEASRGDEALRIAGTHGRMIHLLLTDIVMPGVGGRVLAEHLSTQYPEMKVLYVSGYTDDAVVHDEVGDEHAHFLQKPFSPGTLAHKVREVLAE